MLCRPQPRFWAPNETAGYVQLCPLPADVRCLGWNVTTGRTECGPGYDRNSIGCTACLKHYYPELQLCMPCPATGGAVVVHVFAIILFVSAVAAVAVGVLVVHARMHGGDVKAGLMAAKDFTVWTIVTWQTIVQVGQRSSGGPSVLLKFFATISLVQLDSAVLAHPACYDSYPFAHELQMMIGSFVMMLFTAAMFALPHVKRVMAKLPPIVVSFLPLVKRVALTLMTLYYPLMANLSMSMVHCRTTGGRLTLAANSAYTCFEGLHQPVGVLALFVIIFHVIAFPVATFAWLWHHRDRFDHMPQEWRTTWANFLAQDFKPEYFWFAHVNLAQLLLLAFMLVFGRVASAGSEAAVWLFTTIFSAVPVWLMRRLSPFLDTNTWKVQVLLFAAIVTSFGSFVNFLWFFVDRHGASYRGFATTMSVFEFLLCLALLFVFLKAFWEGVVLRQGTDTAASKPVSFRELLAFLKAGAVPSGRKQTRPRAAQSP